MKFLMLLLICPIFSIAQVEEVPDQIPPPVPNEPALDFVEEEPKFPGGEQGMIEFIVNNVVYPEVARENGEQGIVYVKFVIEKDGAISHVGIRKGVSESLNNEAMRVIKKMPKWIPGKQNGEIVRVNFNLPIHFRLGSDTPDTPKVPLTKKEQKKYDKKVKKAAKVKAKYQKKQAKNG